MGIDSDKKTDRLQKFEDQIQEALQNIEQIRLEQNALTNASDLEAAERNIINATDKLASLLTGLKIQQAIESDQLQEQERQLIQSLPQKLKNQGRRRVEIQTSRGEPVTIETAYYSRKKRTRKKIKKKKR